MSIVKRHCVERKKGNEDLCVAHSKILADLRENSRTDIGPFWNLDQRRNGGTHTYKPNGKWDHVAEDMMINFGESGHPVFRGSSALERGELKSKGKGTLVCTLLWRPQHR